MQRARVITPPTAEPISALECWQHLRLDTAFDSPPPTTVPEATLIAGWLSTAREHAEEFTERTIAPATLEIALGDGFPAACYGRTRRGHGYDYYTYEIALPNGPVQSIISVKYTDTDGAEQTVDPSGYVLQRYKDSDYLGLPFGATWPATLRAPDAVRVRYVAGYSLPGDSPQVVQLPAAIRSALLLMVDHYYRNRGASVVGLTVQELPLGVDALLWPLRSGLGV